MSSSSTQTPTSEMVLIKLCDGEMKITKDCAMLSPAIAGLIDENGTEEPVTIRDGRFTLAHMEKIAGYMKKVLTLLPEDRKIIDEENEESVLNKLDVSKMKVDPNEGEKTEATETPTETPKTDPKKSGKSDDGKSEKAPVPAPAKKRERRKRSPEFDKWVKEYFHVDLEFILTCGIFASYLGLKYFIFCMAQYFFEEGVRDKYPAEVLKIMKVEDPRTPAELEADKKKDEFFKAFCAK